MELFAVFAIGAMLGIFAVCIMIGGGGKHDK